MKTILRLKLMNKPHFSKVTLPWRGPEGPKAMEGVETRGAARFAQVLNETLREPPNETGLFEASLTTADSKTAKTCPLSKTDLEIGTRLGTGKFGQVYLGRDKKSKYVFALKVISKEQLKPCPELRNAIIQEIENQKRLASHPNIVKLFGYFHDSTHIFLLLEYVSGGHLYTHLKECGKFPPKQAASWVRDLARALKHCHDHDILHRDVKLENCLLAPASKDAVKLTDFGWSIDCSEIKEHSEMTGTLDYLPPEMVLGRPYSFPMDIWALGVLTFELLTGTQPFSAPTYRDTYRRIASVDFSFPSDLTDSDAKNAKNFVSALLVKQPEKRLTLPEILEHPFLAPTDEPET